MYKYIQYIKLLLSEAEDRYSNRCFEIKELDRYEYSSDELDLLYDGAEHDFNNEVRYLINNCLDRQLPPRNIRLIFKDYKDVLEDYGLEV